jgi:uncharacterized membrane protein
MILMAVFHFSYDLNRFGVLHYDFNSNLFWVLFRGFIMTSFMLLVGIGFYLGRASYQQASYWMRLWRVTEAAILISVVTAILFPYSWIFFGVLHFVVFASLLGPLLIRAPLLCLPLGAAFIALPEFYSAPWFHQAGWNILGLSRWPISAEDYAPVFPWLGVVMVGVTIGWSAEKWPTRATALENKTLSLLGHHALLFYMTHQVVLFPLAWLISRLNA